MKAPPSDQWPRRVAIVGIGLLGGSVARAIRGALDEVQIIGVVRNRAKQEALVESGIIDSAVDSIEQGCAAADVIVIATPVDKIASMVIEAAQYSSPSCLITDVGSTKMGIVKRVSENQHAASKFVAAHPIAGSEKTGAEHACENLFRDKAIVLTPDPSTSQAKLEQAKQFWFLTGGRIVTLSPHQHDHLLAAISHVPHLASSAIAKLATEQSLDLVGSGWLGTTRVASGDPSLWLAICQENRGAIIQSLSQLASSISEVQRLLEQHDDQAVLRWLDEAKQIRDARG